MTTEKKTENDHLDDARVRLIEAALPHVAFDGWSETTLHQAVADSGVDAGLAKLAFPRGGVDMALGFHRLMDKRLEEALTLSDLAAMRIRERITLCLRKRIEVVGTEREAVRRGAALLALPHYAPEGLRAMWETADVIWRLCGDSSTDYNWYTKRMILSGVYSSAILYWLGDQDPNTQATWDFLDRQIENVMQFEKVKAQVNENPFAKAAFALPNALLGMIRAPGARVP